jgi:hypothetical protein
VRKCQKEALKGTDKHDILKCLKKYLFLGLPPTAARKLTKDKNVQESMFEKMLLYEI